MELGENLGVLVLVRSLPGVPGVPTETRGLAVQGCSLPRGQGGPLRRARSGPWERQHMAEASHALRCDLGVRVWDAALTLESGSTQHKPSET